MNDLRYAIRSLSRSRGFVAVAVLSLALALGLNTTVYAVLDAFTHPTVPYRSPERILRFGGIHNNLQAGPPSRSDVYLFLRERARFVREVAVWNLARRVAESPSGREDLQVADVSANFFRVIEVTPLLGRTFLPGGEMDVVVLSHGAWQRLLSRTPLHESVSISIDGRAHSVVGVMPRAMNLPAAADAWRLIPPSVLAGGLPSGSPQLVGRLVDGVDPEEAKRQLGLLLQQQIAGYRDPRFRLEPYATTLEPDPLTLTRSHLALAGSAALILLIACANLANLMSARGIARRGELALRMAIGASRGALVRQLTTEAAVLAVAGGVLGMVWAGWGVGVAFSQIPQATFITLNSIELSWRVFAFGFLATALTVVLFGLLPAIRASDLNLADPLKESAASITRAPRRYSLLAIAQITLALTSLLSAAVLTRSAAELAGRSFGYPLDNLYQIQVGASIDDRSEVVFHDLLERVRRVSGVRWATIERRGGASAAVSDRESEPVTAVRIAYFRTSADYFRTLGIPIVQGQDFGPTDNELAIVNETAALALWPDERPLGRMVQLEPGVWRRVVGVSLNVGDPDKYHEPRIHVASAADTARRGAILFRTSGSPGIALDVERAVRTAIGPRIYVSAAWPLDGGDKLNLSAKRFLAGLFLFLAVSGLGLAAVGLYGVLAYAVSRRMREFGIRVALGAQTRQLFHMVLHDGAVMFLAGTAVGAFTAMAAAQLVDTLLYRVGFTDVLALVAAEAVLCGVALLACLGPALRASRSDPLEILRAT